MNIIRPMKRTLSFLSGLALLAGCAAARAQIQLLYTTNAGAITITNYSGSGGSLTIPGTINGFPVTGIADEAFLNCVSVTNVTIVSGVTHIGNSAFEACTSLTGVTIPGSVATLGEYAFAATSLTSVTIPGSVTSIGADAFAATSLTSVYFTGNAPAADASVFQYDNGPTVYYLTNTTGWAGFSSNTGLGTVLWNAQIQAGGTGFGLKSNQFGFNITGTANIPVVVEACTNLASPVWIPLQALTLTNGSVHFSEPAQANGSGRYYRLGSQ
jgi:hypothetical protein